jgi:hypothetical protein
MRGILFVLIMHRVKDFTAIALKKAQASTAAIAFSHSQNKAKSCAQIGEISRHKFHCLFCLSVCLLHGSIAVLLFSSSFSSWFLLCIFRILKKLTLS